MKKAGIIVAVCFILLGLLAVNGTLAGAVDQLITGVGQIFQDVTGYFGELLKPESNSVSLQVDIINRTRSTGDNEASSVTLIPADESMMLYPGHYPDGFDWQPTEWVTIDGVPYLLWDDDKVLGSQDRFISISNVSQDGTVKAAGAYYRVAFAVRDDEIARQTIFFNVGAAHPAYDYDAIPIQLDGVDFMMHVFTYRGELAPGETAPAIAVQAALVSTVDNEQLSRLGGNFLQVKATAIEAAAFKKQVETTNEKGETVKVTVQMTYDEALAQALPLAMYRPF